MIVERKPWRLRQDDGDDNNNGMYYFYQTITAHTCYNNYITQQGRGNYYPWYVELKQLKKREHVRC